MSTQEKIIQCIENDNYIKLVIEDGRLDEVQFSSDTKNWLVIGYGDLKAALHTFKRGYY